MEIKENMVVWIDGLNPVLDFINLIQKENSTIAEECFTLLRNKEHARKDYHITFEDRDLFITIIRIDDSFRLIASFEVELINQFLKEEEID